MTRGQWRILNRRRIGPAHLEVMERGSCLARLEDEVTSGRIIRDRISRTDLARMAEEQFGDWIKAVVDVSREIMAVGGDLHADDEAVLLADGSRQRDLWGITGSSSIR